MARANVVVAKEAFVVAVGAKPAEYEKVTIIHNKTGLPVEINKDEPFVPEDPGVPYAFKEGQRVSKNHPAVKEAPGQFVSLEEAEELALEPA